MKSRFNRYLEATNPGTHVLEDQLTSLVGKYMKSGSNDFDKFVDLLESFRVAAFNEGYESSSAWPRSKNEDDQKIGPTNKPDTDGEVGKPISPTAHFGGTV